MCSRIPQDLASVVAVLFALLPLPVVEKKAPSFGGLSHTIDDAHMKGTR